MNFTYIASICMGLGVVCALFLTIDIVNDVMLRYRERFLRESSTELDDVFFELPAEKIFVMSILLGAVGLAVSAGLVILSASPVTYDPMTGTPMGGISWAKTIFVGLTVGIILFSAPRYYLRYKKKKRLEKFNEQLIDVLSSISSALKAGFSINQAIESIAEERNKPISDEFSILVREMRLGVPMDEALNKTSERVKSEDFELVAAAIITARQTGGELTLVLERLAAMIRERLRISGRIRALTAQGRMQAYIIGAMPYLLLIAMCYVAGDMTTEFYNSPLGIIVLIVVTVFVIIGFLMIKKITTIDV